MAPVDKTPKAGEDTFTYGVMHECQAAEFERTLSQLAIPAKK